MQTFRCKGDEGGARDRTVASITIRRGREGHIQDKDKRRVIRGWIFSYRVCGVEGGAYRNGVMADSQVLGW